MSRLERRRKYEEMRAEVEECLEPLPENFNSPLTIEEDYEE